MAQQKNFQYYTYVDDNAVTWNKRGELDPARNAVDGSAAFTPGAPVWRDTRSMRVRRAVFVDATTFRTKSCIVYTPTAFAAITGSTTVSFIVEGNTTGVGYTLAQKLAEVQPVAKASRNLADHT